MTQPLSLGRLWGVVVLAAKGHLAFVSCRPRHQAGVLVPFELSSYGSIRVTAAAPPAMNALLLGT